MVDTYYIKFFRTGSDRHNGILMSLLLLVAETITLNSQYYIVYVMFLFNKNIMIWSKYVAFYFYVLFTYGFFKCFLVKQSWFPCGYSNNQCSCGVSIDNFTMRQPTMNKKYLWLALYTMPCWTKFSHCDVLQFWSTRINPCPWKKTLAYFAPYWSPFQCLCPYEHIICVQIIGCELSHGSCLFTSHALVPKIIFKDLCIKILIVFNYCIWVMIM